MLIKTDFVAGSQDASGNVNALNGNFSELARVAKENNWDGKKLCTIGDSITASGGYQGYLDDIINFSSAVNKGVAGTMVSGYTTTAISSKTRVDQIPKDSDIVIVMGGTNDWVNSVQLGSIGRTIINDNTTKRVDGFFINWTNGGTQANAEFAYSDFYYPLEDGVVYVLESIHNYAIYNSSKSFLSGANISMTVTEVTGPAGGGFIRYASKILNGVTHLTDYQMAKVYKKTSCDTFSGALSLFVERIAVDIPLATLICVGTPVGKYTDYANFTDKRGIKNNIGLSTTDYNDACAKVARSLGVSYIDSSDFGWNEKNIGNYVTYDGAYLHPLPAGYKRMANAIAGKLFAISPRV